MAVRLVACLIAASAVASASVALGGGPGCGCNYAAQQQCSAPQGAACCPNVVVMCGKHHCRHKCCASWMPAPPMGPVVTSVAAPQFATLSAINLVAAPVSLAYAMPQMVAPQAAPQSSEATCQSSGTRLLELEGRIDSLQRRIDRVQTNMEEQTDLLREIAKRLPAK